MRFQDRTDAGKRLAKLLAKRFRNQSGVVYPLPRGGLPLGVEIARELNMPMDLIIPRKIGHPFSPEYAICAVAENGEIVCNEYERAKVDPNWFKKRIEEERKESKRRHELYLAGHSALEVKGKLAILVDDGIATGLTMRAAIRDARSREPARLVVAVPVMPKETVRLLKQEVDDVIAIEEAEYYLGAVGAYYDDFPQLTDDQVIEFIEKQHTNWIAEEQQG